MKKYYAYFPRNFGNEYYLYSVENDADRAAIAALHAKYDPTVSRLTRVTVATMRKWRAAEMWARKHDPSGSGYCDIDPRPARLMNEPV